MADIHAIRILSDRKKVYGRFLDILKSKQKLEILNLNQDVTDETEMSSAKISETKEYISNIHVEMQALVALIQTFTIQLSEEMKRMIAEGLFEVVEEDNDSEGGVGPSAKTGVVGFVNVVLSKLQVSKSSDSADNSGGSKASSRHVDKVKLKKLASLEKMAKQQQDLRELVTKTSEVIEKIEKEVELGTQDIKDITKALHKWSNGLEEEKDRKERKRREREEEKRRKIEEERKRKERDEQKRREDAERKRKEAEEKQHRKDEERKRKEEAERKIKEEERRKEEEETKRQREEEEMIKREKEERQRKEEEDRKRKEEEKREKEEKLRKEEEDRKRKEEEEKREKEEKLRKEEEDRKRKEEEKRKEELKKKEEAERKRKDPNNWPVFVYHRGEKKKSFHSGICCVVSAMENTPPLLKDDLICSVSDKPCDLNECMGSKEEIVLSSLMQIQVKNDIEISLEMPLRIFIPHANLPTNRDIVLKASVDGGKWVSEQQTYRSFQSFKRIKLIAVSRKRREHIVMNRPSSCFTSRVNTDISIKIPNHLKKATSFHLKVDDELFPRGEIQSDENHIMMATPLVGVDFDDVIKNDCIVEIQPNYVKKTVFKTTYARVLHQCSQKLATDMTIDEILQIVEEKKLLNEEKINNIRSKNTNEMMVRALLDEFKDCNAEAFEDLLETLEKANQGHLANYLRDSLIKIQNEEAEVGNDFIEFTEPELSQPVLQIALSVDNGKWEVMDTKPTANLPNVVLVPLPGHGQCFDFLGLVVPKAMSQDAICCKAKELYQRTCQTLIRLIVKQHVDDPTDVYIRCVEASKSRTAQIEMENEGYKSGPTEMAEFGICDNEDIFLTATGNIAFVSNPNSLKFFLNFDIANLKVKVNILNKHAQSCSPNYYGEVKYNVEEEGQKPPRSGSFVVYLPKEEEFRRYAPLALDIPVRAMAKFIALHVTSGKYDAQDLYSRLAKDSRQQRNLRLRAQKEALTGTERELCEAFIKNWANVRPKQEKKVDTLLQTIKEIAPNFLSRAEDFIKPYTAPERAPLANTGIEEMSNLLKDNWKDLASKLNFEEDEIKAMLTDLPDDKRRALNVLDKWRLSDCAIEQGGTNVVRFLYNAMLDSGCNQNLLSMLQKHL